MGKNDIQIIIIQKNLTIHCIARFSFWAQRDLNSRPKDYESSALTAELQALVLIAQRLNLALLIPNFKPDMKKLVFLYSKQYN